MTSNTAMAVDDETILLEEIQRVLDDPEGTIRKYAKMLKERDKKISDLEDDLEDVLQETWYR